MFSWLKTHKLISCDKCLRYGAISIALVAILFYQNCSVPFGVQKDSSQVSVAAPASTPVPTPEDPISPAPPVVVPPVSTVTPTLNRTDFVTSLNEPWDLAFTADNYMFFTEKCRGLSVRRPDGTIARLFGTTGSTLVASDFFCLGQSGMHGVALHPSFSTNRYVYVYMPSNINTNPRTNRVIRLVVDPTYSSVSNRVDIITDIAFKNVQNNWGGAGSHSGGRLRFDSNANLYVTTGDNHNGTLPQSLQRLGGKVLRVDLNGTAAAGNNSPVGGDPRIFTYGHRNIQGIAFRPASSQVFTAEHGPGHTDEINLLAPGANSGWDPAPDTGVTCADNYCGYISNKSDGSPTSMTDLKKFPNAITPIWTNGGNSEGTGPLTFLSGAQWKAWNGRLLVGVMGDQRLTVLQLNTNGTMMAAMNATLTPARYRSLVQGPDGNLYIATDGGAIWRVTPQ